SDVTVSMAVEAGQLQLNAFEPIIAHSLFQSITWLERACQTLRVNCVDGITANEEHLADTVARSVTVITALAPVIGYYAATSLVNEALATGVNVSDMVIQRGFLDQAELDQILQPKKLAGLAPETGMIDLSELHTELDQTSVKGEA